MKRCEPILQLLLPLWRQCLKTWDRSGVSFPALEGEGFDYCAAIRPDEDRDPWEPMHLPLPGGACTRGALLFCWDLRCWAKTTAGDSAKAIVNRAHEMGLIPCIA